MKKPELVSATGLCLVKKFSLSAPLKAYCRNKYHNKICVINCTIVHNSGKWLAVLQGVLEMEWVMRVYGQSLVKNRGRYWPKGVTGDMIDAYFKESPLIIAKPLRKH